MMEESAVKSGSVQEYVGSIVDFAPFGFTNTIQLLMFWVGCFKFNSKVIACCDKFCGCESRSGIGADEADGFCLAK
jgi:hypothetical protein